MTITRAQLRAAFPVGQYVSRKKVARDLGISRQRVYQLLKKYHMLRPNVSLRDFDELSAHEQYKRAPRSHFPREGLPAYRKKHGICQKCRQPVSPGHTYCAGHLATMRQHAKDKRNS